jgi:trimeric autotransporter adhesin
MFATRWRFVLIASIAMAGRLSAQSIFTVAGGGTDDGRPAIVTALANPYGVALDAAGNLYVADTNNNRIRRVAAGSGIISTVAGNGGFGFSGDGGPATAAGLYGPRGVAVDATGTLYIADTFSNRIREVAAGSGIISTVAGNDPIGGFSGDGLPATAARLGGPTGVAVDAAGNLYIADSGNNRIRKVAAGSGIISTVAGSSGPAGPYTGGFTGDGGPATTAMLSYPSSAVFDVAGNLYIADTGNHRIRKVAAGSGIISTIAGSGPFGENGGRFSGDGGPATAASLNGPSGVALDAAGNLYIADTSNNRIRKVAAGSAIISTVAGNGPVGNGGFSGDGGPATAATLYFPSDVAVDAAGNLYVADNNNNRIRKVAAGSGIISTVAGNGTVGFSGDGGPATAAAISLLIGVALDATAITAGSARSMDMESSRQLQGTVPKSFPGIRGPRLQRHSTSL